MNRFPSIFISHGAPTMSLEPTPARDFYAGFGAALGKPKAIVAVSAHNIAREVLVRTAPQLHAVHDFGGFPEALYQMQYDVPGDPVLARTVAELIAATGREVATHPDAGIDHGVWVPLKLMYPEADVPVVPLSLKSTLSEAEHLAIGRALAPLREEGVLIIGSGSLTHNLYEFGPYGLNGEPPAYVRRFADWVSSALESGDTESLLNWRKLAPEAGRAHPTPEHFLPLFVALGAGGEQGKASVAHASYSHGILAMHSFQFD